MTFNGNVLCKILLIYNIYYLYVATIRLNHSCSLFYNYVCIYKHYELKHKTRQIKNITSHRYVYNFTIPTKRIINTITHNKNTTIQHKHLDTIITLTQQNN